MHLFKDQLEKLENDLSAENITISPYHDLPFAIFRYQPELEFEARKEIGLLATRLGNRGKKVHIISLAELYYEAIDLEGGIQKLVEEEKEIGFSRTQEMSLANILTDEDYSPITRLLANRLNNIPPENAIVLLIRAGVFAPNAYRISVLLEYMKGKTTIPCILFYPGSIKDNVLYFMDMFDQPPGSYHVNIYNRE